MSEIQQLTLKLNPLSNLMFKLLYLLCFNSGGKSKMLKLLGFTRLGLKCCRVDSLGQKRWAIPSKNLTILGKCQFNQIFFMLEMVSIDKEICRQELGFH
jgi:hypothetical protein